MNLPPIEAQSSIGLSDYAGPSQLTMSMPRRDLWTNPHATRSIDRSNLTVALGCQILQIKLAPLIVNLATLLFGHL